MKGRAQRAKLKGYSQSNWMPSWLNLFLASAIHLAYQSQALFPLFPREVSQASSDFLSASPCHSLPYLTALLLLLGSVYCPRIKASDLWLHLRHLQSWLSFDFCPIGIDNMEVALWDRGVLSLQTLAPIWLLLIWWSPGIYQPLRLTPR